MIGSYINDSTLNFVKLGKNASNICAMCS